MTTIASEIERLHTAKADIKASLEAKGVTVDSAATLDVYDDYVDEIPEGSSGYKDVIFIDYDGTVLYQYTAEEFLALTAMPANPTGRTGFVAQGWNWSLADAQDYVERYGSHCIGQMYDTVDGSTLINVTLDGVILNVGLVFSRYSGSDSDITIDWGDGTEETTARTHIYASAGTYDIHIKTANGTKIYWPNQNYQTNRILYDNEVHGGIQDCSGITSGYVNYIHFGSNAYSIGQYCIPEGCALSFSPGFTDMTGYVGFAGSSVIFPNTLTRIQGSLYNNLMLSIPNSVTYINLYSTCEYQDDAYALYIPRSCTTLSLTVDAVERIIIPNTVENLPAIENATRGVLSKLKYLLVEGSYTTIPAGFLCLKHLNIEIHMNLGNATSIGAGAFRYINTTDIIGTPVNMSNLSVLYNRALPVNTVVSSIKSDATIQQYGLSELKYSNNILDMPAGVTVSADYIMPYVVLDKLILNSNTNLYIGAYQSVRAREIVFNFDVASLPNNLFNYVYETLTYDFTSCTSVPTLGSNTFVNNGSMRNEAQILVPAVLYEDWIVSSGWSSYASRIVPVGDIPYEPTQEETEDINAILGEDSSDPIIPDITEEEAEEILDDIIGGE